MSRPKNAVPVDTVPPRRRFLQVGALGGMAATLLPAMAGARETAPCKSGGPQVPHFEFDEFTIAGLQSAMSSGSLSCRSLAEKYMTRIAEVTGAGQR